MEDTFISQGKQYTLSLREEGLKWTPLAKGKLGLHLCSTIFITFNEWLAAPDVLSIMGHGPSVQNLIDQIVP